MTSEAEPVAVPELQHGDIIHIKPHEVFRHDTTAAPHLVACKEADVEVDVLVTVGTIVVICWLIPPPAGEDCACPRVCGAVVYDADDSVLREVVAA